MAGSTLPEVRELLEGLLDGSHSVGTRIDQGRGAITVGRDHAGAVRHLAVSECRTILDHQYALAANAFGIGNGDSCRPSR